MTSPAPQEPRLGVFRLLLLAVAFGLVGGLVEGTVLASKQLLGGRMSLFGAEALWLAPLVQGGVFGLLAVAYGALGAMLGRLRSPGVAVTVWGGLAALGAVGQFERIHWLAGAVLAFGIGVGLARAFADRAARLAARAVGVLAAVLILAAVGQRSIDGWTERAALARPAAGAGHPNVLLLVLDTVRAWNLGWYGYGRNTTPLLDRRFENGVIFDRALATAPWTLPSHASMFTGRFPADLSAGWTTRLDSTDPTVAEVLAQAGYSTGGFVANYRYAGASTGLARGFSRYVDYPKDVPEALRMLALTRRALRIPWLQQWLVQRRIFESKYAEDVNREFLDWVDQRTDRPFFGFINYIDAHSPYLPPAPYDTAFNRGADQERLSERYLADVERVFGPGPIPSPLLTEYVDGYDGSLRYQDAQIDSLLNALERRGRLENTIVVVTSDHGEHFGEHGLIQHGNSLFLPLLHVPLVVWGPGLVPGGLRIGAPTSLRNLAATLVDLAGVQAPAIPGRSLARLWGPDSLDVPPDTLLSAVDWHPSLTKFPPAPLLEGSLRSLLVDSLHYIRRSDGVEELYHLGRDFLEARNLAGVPQYRAALLDARGKLEAVTRGVPGPRAK